jgi:hypothetical protein
MREVLGLDHVRSVPLTSDFAKSPETAATVPLAEGTP